MLVETVLAWLFGSARAGAGRGPDARPTGPVAYAALVPAPWPLSRPFSGSLFTPSLTGEFLGFLPASLRHPGRAVARRPAGRSGRGHPLAAGIASAYLTGDAATDRWLVAGALVLRRAVRLAGLPPGAARADAAGPLPVGATRSSASATLRLGLLALALAVLLPQVRLAFEREGWPDVVVVIDDSRSMGVVDTFRDPAVQARADELKASGTGSPPRGSRPCATGPTRSTGRSPRTQFGRRRPVPRRTGPDRGPRPGPQDPPPAQPCQGHARVRVAATGCGRSCTERQMRVHVYRVSGQATRMAELNDPAQCEKLLDELMDVAPAGESSQLGTGVESVLKTFRGGSLNAIVMFTDGVTTRGEDLPAAARSAARAGVPLYLVGVGRRAPSRPTSILERPAGRGRGPRQRPARHSRPGSPPRAAGCRTRCPSPCPSCKDGKPVELARADRAASTRRQAGQGPVRAPAEGGRREDVRRPGAGRSPTRPSRATTGSNTGCSWPRPGGCASSTSRATRGTTSGTSSPCSSASRRRSRGEQVDRRGLVPARRQPGPPEARPHVDQPRSRPATSCASTTWSILGDVDPKQLPRADARLRVAGQVREGPGRRADVPGRRARQPARLPRHAAGRRAAGHPSDGPPRRPRGPAAHRELPAEAHARGQGAPAVPVQHRGGRERRDLEPPAAALLVRPRATGGSSSAEVLAVHPTRPAEGPAGPARRTTRSCCSSSSGPGGCCSSGSTTPGGGGSASRGAVQPVLAAGGPGPGPRAGRPHRGPHRPQDVPPRRPGEVHGPVPRRRPAAGGAGAGDGGPRPPETARGAAPEPESQTVQLAPGEGVRATYEALITRTPEGDYAFTLASPAAPVNGRGPRSGPAAAGRIGPDPAQRARTCSGRPASRGGVLPARPGRQGARRAAGRPRVALDQPVEPLALWNSPALFALVLGLLTAEWVMRKKWRLL